MASCRTRLGPSKLCRAASSSADSCVVLGKQWLVNHFLCLSMATSQGLKYHVPTTRLWVLFIMHMQDRKQGQYCRYESVHPASVLHMNEL